MEERNIEVLAALEELWETRLKSAQKKAEKIVIKAKTEAEEEYNSILKDAQKEAENKKKAFLQEAANRINELEQDAQLRKQWLNNVDVNSVSKDIFPEVLKNMV